MDEFKLLNKSRYLLRYIEENILVNIPKVFTNYRKGLEDSVINLIYNIIRANVNNGNIRNKYQKEALVDIQVIDMYLDILLELNIISKKKFMSIIRMLNEIRKMTLGWIESEKKK